MQKIGLFLDSAPGAGAFQYCQIILESFSYFAKNGYSVVIAYQDPAWESYFSKIEDINIKKVLIKKHVIFMSFFYDYILKSNIDVSIKRNILAYIHPIPNTLIKQKCDLWFFPTRK